MYINDLGYFWKLRIQKESENISEWDLEVYINHLDKLKEDFKIRFGDLDNMHIPECLISQSYVKIYHRRYECDIEDWYIEMYVDLVAIALLESENPPNIGAISILLLSSPSSEQQLNLSYLHSQLHGWFKLAYAMWIQ